MSSTYRAAVVRVPGGPEAIELIDLPVRHSGAGQVRVRIEAAGVNPVDLAVADGYFHSIGLIDQPEHAGLGWDFAGTVIEAGDGVDLTVGTRVAGIVPGLDRDLSGYAEEIVAPLEWIAPVPDGLSTVEAATLPLNTLTAAQVVDLLGDGDGRQLLVTGAAGAVGGYVAPLAAERGWVVTGLARAEDEAFVRGLGVAFTADVSDGWDAVADPAGLQERGVALVRNGGVFVGVLPPALPGERDITARAVDVTPDAARLAELLGRAGRGDLPARVHAELPLAEAAEAHRAVAKGGVRGRYVLRP
ncbi:NADP-dependent oxidoreductase [Nocardioides antri]|uniref:NADP-dependent oxidoreductase n=1 Tax=Nocardioides antri TaxID=2607659 RepID=A0A5B1M490_9ACTN|nr:NADP-dependent oxidoreductase [Nocardioides antri]KAA1427752.1 NADP-dependent oxidoreductase [Nocardioides antri]